jgi:hypothetical protein
LVGVLLVLYGLFMPQSGKGRRVKGGRDLEPERLEFRSNKTEDIVDLEREMDDVSPDGKPLEILGEQEHRVAEPDSEPGRQSHAGNKAGFMDRSRTH